MIAQRRWVNFQRMMASWLAIGGCVASVLFGTSSGVTFSESATIKSAPAPRAVAPGLRRLKLSGVDHSSLAIAAGVSPGRRRAQLAREGVDATEFDDLPELLTAPLSGPRFDAVGISWDRRGATAPAVWVRVREATGWSSWNLLPPLDVGPDAGGAERSDATRVSTEPLVTDGATALQVRMDAGGRLKAVRADLIDAGRSPADDAVPATPVGATHAAGPLAAPPMAGTQAITLIAATVPATPLADTQAAAATAAPARPSIISRAEWGADESIRGGEPEYASSIKVGVIHHTATSNSYSVASTYAQIRSIYAYHTLSLGWSDIAYNILVDKFGRLFEGRYGGLDQPVIGAATGGFNRYTFSVSALGNYTEVAAPPAMVESIARVMAWKFSIHYVNPQGTSQLTSAGADTSRYPAGQVATVPNVMAHRDTNYTGCPGENLYGELNAIRYQIKQLLPAGLEHPAATTIYRTPTANGSVRFTSGMLYGGNWALRVRDMNGALVRQYVGTGWSIDVTWPMETSSGAPVLAGTYQVQLDTDQNGASGLPFARWVSTADILGNFEGVAVTPGGTVASGWAAVSNGDTATVALVTDGSEVVRVLADQPRPDVGSVYPALGPNRGFSGISGMTVGRHLVCVWGERAKLQSKLMGCRWFDNPPDEPFGNVDAASPQYGGLQISGWTIDRNTAASISARFYVDQGYGGDRTADRSRPDVASVYPAYGPDHGFSASLNTGPGNHNVCVNGLNAGPGSPEGFIRCVTASTITGPPIGNVDSLQVGTGSVTVQGWTFDPDVTRPISVHIYIDGAFGGAFTAAVSRPDLEGPFPFMGTAHGFKATVGASTAGRHTVCVYAINDGPPDVNPPLGCRSFG